MAKRDRDESNSSWTKIPMMKKTEFFKTPEKFQDILPHFAQQNSFFQIKAAIFPAPGWPRRRPSAAGRKRSS
jgi:hypothetical protein